ncbi:hypothetical protein CXB38_14300 [Pseudomonas syringae]|uniref:hypothetical protein n=1 Tax=Pseudomonas syringae TaxID=317 RepID=UPI000CDB4830|nr:hypothetical protein [Pseudomonas syringae]POP81263.1 hypothetical protein CXB38_14300 [Pseudomonas syringae]
MPVFGLVTEGGTDQAIIKNVVNGLALRVLGDEVDWSVAQPEVAAGKQVGKGGWEQLFEFLGNRDLITDALLRANCLIVHVDSDCAEHKNFGVKLHLNGVGRPTFDIIQDIVSLLISKVHPEVYAQFADRFLFAVAVHSIECWLLPLFGKKRSFANEQKCERKVAVELISQKRGDRYVERRDKKLIKKYNLFLELSEPYYEDVDVRTISHLNESLEIFVANASLKLLAL